jgi:hypothetical protein
MAVDHTITLGELRAVALDTERALLESLARRAQEARDEDKLTAAERRARERSHLR